MGDYGIKVAKEGHDVISGEDKDMSLHSRYNTFKFQKTGRLTLEVPSETLTYAGSAVHSNHVVSYEHNLGYLPFYLPRGNLFTADSTTLTGSSDLSIYVNDQQYEPILYSYSPTMMIREIIQVFVTADKLNLLWRREVNGMFMPGDVDYYSAEAYVDYVVFYNQMDQEVDLLPES
jgi:hypothetical protein